MRVQQLAGVGVVPGNAGSGQRGSQWWPFATITARYRVVVSSPPSTGRDVTSHVWPGAGRTVSTSVRKRMRSRSPKRSTNASKYAAIWKCDGKSGRSSGIGNARNSMSRRDVLMCSERYAADWPLSLR